MMIWPLPGVPGSDMLRAFQDVERAASNIHAHGSGGRSIVDAYLRWVSDAAQRLRPLVGPAVIRQLVLTDTYWTVLTMANPSAAPPLMRALQDEIRSREQDWQMAVRTVDAFLQSWESTSGPTEFVVVDSNVFLHHDQELDGADWHDIIKASQGDIVRIVLPLIVIDELDNQKREATRARARRALRTIYEHSESNPHGVAILQSGSADRGAVELRLLLDDPGHIRLPRPDDELVGRAIALQWLLDRPVNFVTYDTGAALRAAAAGLHAHRLVHEDAG